VFRHVGRLRRPEHSAASAPFLRAPAINQARSVGRDYLWVAKCAVGKRRAARDVLDPQRAVAPQTRPFRRPYLSEHFPTRSRLALDPLRAEDVPRSVRAGRHPLSITPRYVLCENCDLFSADRDLSSHILARSWKSRDARNLRVRVFHLRLCKQCQQALFAAEPNRFEDDRMRNAL
jgi:hypothetical protein